MKDKKARLVLILALAALALPALLAAENRVSTFEKTLSLTPGRPVSVEFRDSDGDVTFTVGDASTVGIKVRKETDIRDAERAQRRLDEITVEVTQNGNEVRIEIRYPHRVFSLSSLWHDENVRVRSEVVLPRECRLAAVTSDGDIRATGMAGDVSLKTSDGNIFLAQAEGRLTTSTSDGDLTLRELKGEVEAHTSDGDIDVSGVFSRLTLSASDGNITAHVLPGSKPSSAWEVRTSDGDIDLFLVPEMSADLWIRSGDGSILCDLPVTVQGKTEEHSLRGTLGSGGPLVTVRTSDGDVRLKRLS